MGESIADIRQHIIDDPSNKELRDKGYEPVFVAHEEARILVVGQAPGIKAQTLRKAWGDASGLRLVQWLGIDEATFRDETKVALMPMDFYYPGKGKSGDLPPRKNFAPTWHPKLLTAMPHIQLTVLVGSYAQAYYLGPRVKRTLTETVLAYDEYAPEYFPIVHPSPLNFRWIGKNPWFEASVVPALQAGVKAVLG